MDVAIVGAGPAGARAACVLARHGARVTIFDASHPREKPCGGGVTGRALALVADAIDATSSRGHRFTPRRVRPPSRLTAAGGQAPDRTGLTTRESATVDLDRGALVVASRADIRRARSFTRRSRRAPRWNLRG